MKYYKELLLNKLTHSGWELLEIDENTDWWLESAWKIKSIKQNYGLELYILFLVDLQYEGTKKESAVYAVNLHRTLPVNYPLDDGLISISLHRGKFNESLSKFIIQLNEFRNSSF